MSSFEVVDANGLVRVGNQAVGGGVMALFSRVLLPVELRGLTDAAPLTLIPGRSGYAHAFYDFAFSFTVGGTQYTDGADLFVSLGPSANGWFDKIATSAAITGASNALAIGGVAGAGWTSLFGSGLDPTEFSGQPLSLVLDPNSAPNTPFAAGNGTLTISFLYADVPA